MMTIIGSIFLVLGFLWIVIAAVGVLRLPDFYTRLHASGGSETLGMILAFFGLALIEGFTLISVKFVFIIIFILLANPVGTHILSRAAYKNGLAPWTKKGE